MRNILFVLLIVMLFSCKDENENKPGTITGNVSALVGDKAISDARIVTTPSSDTVYTNSNGDFSLNNVVPGNYSVIAHKEGYTDGLVPIIVFENSTSTATFKLSRESVDLKGQWEGKIRYYTTDYPLLMNFDTITSDSIFGSMVIDFTEGAITFPIQSQFYFSNDSLHFSLSYSWGMCHAYEMWGLVVNKDSLQGNWMYRCINDPIYTSPWSAHRKTR
jgi:hypothetical protein